MPVDAKHRVKISLTGERCTMAYETRQPPFLNITCHRVAFRDRSIRRRRGRCRLGWVVIVWRCSRLAGVVVLRLRFRAVAPSHSDHFQVPLERKLRKERQGGEPLTAKYQRLLFSLTKDEGSS